MQQKLLWVGVGVALVAVIAASCLAGWYFYTQQRLLASNEAAMAAQKEKDALFEPVINTKNISCEVPQEYLGRSARQIYVNMEVSDPAKVSRAIVALVNKYPGGTVSASGSSYDDTTVVNSSQNVNLVGTVPPANADEFVAAIKKMKDNQTVLITSQNDSSNSAQNVVNDCLYNLNNAKAMELKEATYLAQLRPDAALVPPGSLMPQSLDQLVQQLSDVRANFVSTVNSGVFDPKKKLDSASFNISISTLRG